MKLRVVSYLLFAWIVPAAIAGMLGWDSIWGGQNAFGDYLIPVPVAGGALHVPSILICMVLISLRPQAGLSRVARPLLLGIAGAGAVLLLNAGDLYLKATTDLSGPVNKFSENPLGLFMLSDGLLAQFWLPLQAREDRRPIPWIAALLTLTVPPLLALQIQREANTQIDSPFVYGGSRQGEHRGDNITAIYSRGGFSHEQLIAAVGPSSFVVPPTLTNNEADAVYFFDSLAAAKGMNLDAARVTYCLYEDGTPPEWITGSGDCFRNHVSFSEKLEQIRDGTNPRLYPDVRTYLALKKACEGVVLVQDARFSSIESQDRCSHLPDSRERALSAKEQLSELDLQAMAD